MLAVPIFPLPEVTFFPGTLLPLHVFEARYRAMVIDALGTRRRLAVAGLQPGYEADYAGKPAVYQVAGAGEIVAAERLANGRYNIVLRGDARIRITGEVPSDTLYRIAAAETVEDVPPGRDPAAVLERIRATCARLLDAVARPPGLLDEALDGRQPPGTIADRIAAAVLPSASVRQELLETTDVERRLKRLVTALDELVAELSGGRE